MRNQRRAYELEPSSSSSAEREDDIVSARAITVFAEEVSSTVMAAAWRRWSYW